VDVAFPEGELPRVLEAVEVGIDQALPLVLEVQQHLDRRTVRAVALQVTSGLRRGAPVTRTGGPLMMPVGPTVLGRLVDVLGRPTDGGRSAASRDLQP